MADETTVLTFRCYPQLFFEAVRFWALAHAFKMLEEQDNYRLYGGRPAGLAVGASGFWLIAEHDGQMASLKAWYGYQEKNRSPIHRGFWNAQRGKYRTQFNELLDSLGQPRI